MGNAVKLGRVTAFVVAMLFAVVPGAMAADAKDADWPALQGTWVVAAAEQGGKPFDDIKGGHLVVKDRKFDLVTASGNKLEGTLSIDSTARPKQLDFLLANGERWLAIFTVSETNLRLNYVEAENGAVRPAQFATASGQPGTVISLKKDAP